MAAINEGDRVAVVGQGLIGHAAAQICRLKGARVLTADTIPARVELSRLHAADRAVNSLEENLAERISEFTEGQGVDVVIDTSGSTEMIRQEVEFLKRFGKLVFQGWYPPPSGLDLHRMQLKFAHALFPCGHSGDAVARCMQWMREGKLSLLPLITHRFRPDQAPEAYNLVLNHPQDTIGIIFNWGVA